MGLFRRQKSDDQRSRRNSRVQSLRLREFGLTSFVVLTVIGMGAAGYYTGSFTRIINSAAAYILNTTANAGFKVKEILVTGRSHVTAETVLANLSIKTDMPLFGVDIRQAQQSLSEISWVKDASIQRRLPDTIVVELQERIPVALWQYQKKISVIDQEGVVLATDSLAEYASLPLVVGQDAPQNLPILLNLMAAEPSLAAQIESSVRVGNRRWDLHLKNGMIVKLPEKDLELAFRHLALQEEQHKILDQNLRQIDLRQPEKMVVLPTYAINKT